MNTNQHSGAEDDALICKIPWTVKASETDVYSRLRLGSLVNMFIQAAIQSSDQMEFGYHVLRKKNLFWVFSRLTTEICKPVRWGQSLEVSTWPRDVEKIMYLRDYIIRDDQQEVVVKATSGWMAIDLNTKRPGTLEAEDAWKFTRLKDLCALDRLPEKIMPVKEGQTTTLKTTYFDLDLNGHVTSSRYVDWMMDAFSLDFHRKYYPKKLSINFLHEAGAGEDIGLRRHALSEKAHAFEAWNHAHAAVNFRGYLEF